MSISSNSEINDIDINAGYYLQYYSRLKEMDFLFNNSFHIFLIIVCVI